MRTDLGVFVKAGGSFTSIAYLTGTPFGPGRRFRGRLGAAFDEVLTTRTIWRNLPPARPYVCRRPVAPPRREPYGSRRGSQGDDVNSA
ncbi:hypothetical protein ACFSKW_20190 [Nonomuraea mangrovi]|uniref:Uncharacterized protein n=1 Tax=Nonomuraea mangrovi TaxID=2316207 RepID=A0ABW4SX00_9ACTN